MPCAADHVADGFAEFGKEDMTALHALALVLDERDEGMCVRQELMPSANAVDRKLKITPFGAGAQGPPALG